MCDDDCFHIGREENFWPLAGSLARGYNVLLSNGLTAAHIASIMEMNRAKAWEMKTLPELAISPPDSVSSKFEDLTIDTNSLAPFEYKPLDEAESIRVLILHPGKPSEPLRGTIRHQLYRRASYEAISYAWGSDSTPCSMILDGHRMPLTQSLHDALVRLRRRKHGRILWADGVSINQTDSKEKSVQVGLMPEIFKQAKVLVYLGREEFQSEAIPYLVEKLRKFDLKSVTSAPQPKRTAKEFLEANGLPPQNHISWLALVPFLRRPWFMRMWVVQEIVLAREVRFFCGDWELGWRDLVNVANCVGKFLRKALPDIPEDAFHACDKATASLGLMLGFRTTRSLAEKRLEDILNGMKQKSTLDSEIDVIDGKAKKEIEKDRDYVIQACRANSDIYDFIEGQIVGLPDEVLPSKTPMLYLLGLFSHNRATRYQDRLYALAGLSCDISLADFPPDYDETLEQTNLRFGRVLVKQGQGMDLLYHATKWSSELENPHLPTWAADWTRPRHQFDHWLKLSWAYHGGWSNVFAAPSSVRLNEKSSRVLDVTGFQIASITSAIKFNHINSARALEGYDAIADLKQFFSGIVNIFGGEPYFTGEPWEEVAARTLITNHIPQKLESEPISKMVSLYQHFVEHIACLDKEKVTQSNIWAGDMVMAMIGNAVFKTDSGYVGIAPETITPGDEIYMLESANLPFVLRPSTTKPGYHQFLGGCYIHGLMAGKAWDLEHRLSELSLI